MHEALELAEKLNNAKAYRVRDWQSFHHEIPEKPGAYKFTDSDGFRVYVGETKKSLRERLRHQIYPARRLPWSWSNPPPKSICSQRNLLNNVLKDLNDGRPLWWPDGEINRSDQDTIDLLNDAFRRIDELMVRWVSCPDGKMAKRVEHLANRCALDNRCARRA